MNLQITMIEVASLQDDERICSKCLEIYKARPEDSQKSIGTIVE